MLMRPSDVWRYVVLCCLPATAWAASASADWLAQIAMGLGEGLRRVGLAVVHGVLHPGVSADGIALALSDRRQGLEAWQAAVTHGWAGLAVDPAGSAGVIVMWMVCAAGSVAVAAGLSAGGARLWRLATRWRSAPRRSGRVGRLRRAWAMRVERRRGELSARWGWWQDAGHGVADLLATPRLLRRHGLAGVRFLGWRLRRGLGRLVAVLLRQLGQQFAYLALPLVLLAGPWIDLGLQREATARHAARTLVPATRDFLADAPGASAPSLMAQAMALRQRYAAHRQALLAPIVRLDRRLDADLNALDALVGAGPVDSGMLDHRLDGALDRFVSDRLRWVGQLVWPLPDRAPDPLAVPHTWFESRATEHRLFAQAREQAADPAARAALDTLLTTLDAEWDYDICLRAWDPNLLLDRPWSAEEAAEAARECGRRP
ncbi:hypothetical protein [Denitromonas ohlonensis]|uniref:DUF2868 domain-containing protein n=2 Tax=Denitromonas TaxID=139331 RepID=A0A557SPD7_9RHOO|nr:hypothetical protein [Denitromonas ohlonensis]TVO67188.1 hypothetical protein FHP90_08505 [Denitromonas ohlonensis]TVO79248.1 hypothetical protein FHP89_03425 [Denitromonas ohlonensis]